MLKEMEAAGALLAKGSIKHEYPHSWRSKAPVIFRTTPQWFIAMDGEGRVREKALAAIDETRWIPEKGQTRIRAMIAGRPDWCISRQRTWGVPIAIFLHKKTGEPLRDEAVLNRTAEIFMAEGSDAWWARPAQDFLKDQYKAEDYQQVFDIVDVWFESGCTHAFVLEDRPELQSPADLYLEGSDQHRGWFHSSLLESCGTRGHPPYKAVLTHGFVLDEKGYKMSKSVGNVVDPLEMMQQHGADIIRLWTMLSDYAEDIRIGKDTLKLTADLYRRIRNTLRYLLGALDGFTAVEKINAADMPELERYMLHLLTVEDAAIRTHIKDYEFGKLAKRLHDFCNGPLSSFYFDIRKDSLYCDAADAPTRRACRTVMAEIFSCLTAWLAPILAFTAEEAWAQRPQDMFEDVASVHLRTFPTLPTNWQDENLVPRWQAVEQIRAAVNAAIEPARKEKIVGSSLEAAPVVRMNAATITELNNMDLAELCITSAVQLRTDDTLSANFALATGEKCIRCWKVLPEVGENKEHPQLCRRCAKAVSAMPITRQVA